MSEYVVEEPSDSSASWRVREEIVRCRDCEHFSDYHFKCHRPAHIIDAHGNLYWESEGLMSVTDAGPDGFCAWGERRDA